MLRVMDAFTPAVELAAAIRRKEISPVEVADLYLDRIEQFDGTLNAFCHRADDEVRDAAKRAADVVATTDTADLPAVLRCAAADQGPQRRGWMAVDARDPAVRVGNRRRSPTSSSNASSRRGSSCSA